MPPSLRIPHKCRDTELGEILGELFEDLASDIAGSAEAVGKGSAPDLRIKRVASGPNGLTEIISSYFEIRVSRYLVVSGATDGKAMCGGGVMVDHCSQSVHIRTPTTGHSRSLQQITLQ